MSTFTHPHVVSNLYDFLSPVEHKRRHLNNTIDFNCMAGGGGTEFFSKKKESHAGFEQHKGK